MSEEEKLKPCPFCGQQPDVSMGGSFVTVSCPRCKYEFDWARHGGFDWRGEWNARPIEGALEDRLAAITHEWEITVTSRAYARKEWERLEKENAALKDALQEILKFAASRVLQSGIVIPSPLDWDALESIYQEAATALAKNAPKEGEG